MYKVHYSGPIVSFGTIICRAWEGTTLAETIPKAKSNLTFQAKVFCGKTKDSLVTLPGSFSIEKVADTDKLVGHQIKMKLE